MIHLFDPNGPAQQESGVFNLPHDERESNVILIPVPWDATCSGSAGTALGPHAIFDASKSLDLGSYDLDNPWAVGIYMQTQPMTIYDANSSARNLVLKTSESVDHIPEDVNVVDILCEQMNQHVEQSVLDVIQSGKIPGVVGGDNSISLGAYRALDNLGMKFGVLHIDAHLDMRESYEGFKYSHASVMFNATQTIQGLTKVVTVGVRDFGPKEIGYKHSLGDLSSVYYDIEISNRLIKGETFDSIVGEIISDLPDNVWISFDIDGLDPSLCPNTGTPVPGGLDFSEARYLISELGKSGKTILGFDLSEVAPGDSSEVDINANVGMRILYDLISYAALSHGLTDVIPSKK